jgi:hypothetical protein
MEHTPTPTQLTRVSSSQAVLVLAHLRAIGPLSATYGVYLVLLSPHFTTLQSIMCIRWH